VLLELQDKVILVEIHNHQETLEAEVEQAAQDLILQQVEQEQHLIHHGYQQLHLICQGFLDGQQQLQLEQLLLEAVD
jgi:hypothetical protein